MKIKYLLFAFVLFLSDFAVFAQENYKKEFNYQEIEKKIDSLHNSPKKAWEFIEFYVRKSKIENNNEALLYAYRYASNYSKSPLNIKYADSALSVARISQNKKFLANAFLNKGVIFMNEALYQKALDNILAANQYSTETGDQYIIYKTVYLIAQNKIYLGLYEDANVELAKCVEFFKKNSANASLGKDYKTYYVFSLLSYIDSNTKIGRIEENKNLINEGITFLKANKLNQYIPYFISSEGTDAYYQNNFKLASAKLTEALEMYNDQWPHITEIYYLGLNNWKMGKRTLAVKFMEEIDNQYNKTNKLDPQFRSAYEILIKYNDSIKNRDKQLEYINKLMILDKSYEKNFKYLYPKINKEYDTRKLIAEKDKIERLLSLKSRALTATMIISIIILFIFMWRNYTINRKYKKIFDNIVNTPTEHSKLQLLHENTLQQEIKTEKEIKPEENKIPEEPVLEEITLNNINKDEYYYKIPSLNPSVVKTILKQLETFEFEERYLDSQLTQKSMVEELGTNSTYLSKIINTYKGSNFNVYINNLRLDYLVDLLQKDSSYLLMDVKELSNISGFSNAESFSDNFFRKFKIKPSYFIKMMKEKSKTSALSHNPTSD